MSRKEGFTPSLHVIDHERRGIVYDEQTRIFKSGSWRLGKERLTLAKTIFLFVHEDSKTPSYLAGRIVRFSDDLNRPGRTVVTAQKMELSMRWPNDKSYGSAFMYGPAPPDQAILPPVIHVASDHAGAPAPIAVPEAGPPEAGPPVTARAKDLYVAENSLFPGMFKVGISGNVPQRMAELERSHPFRVKEVATFPGREGVERDVHQALQAYLVTTGTGTEWFKAPLSKILGAIGDAIEASRSVFDFETQTPRQVSEPRLASV
jgi:T5orf172 domain